MAQYACAHKVYAYMICARVRALLGAFPTLPLLSRLYNLSKPLQALKLVDMLASRWQKLLGSWPELMARHSKYSRLVTRLKPVAAFDQYTDEAGDFGYNLVGFALCRNTPLLLAEGPNIAARVSKACSPSSST